MINSPIKVKDYINPIESVRNELIKPNGGSKKGLVLKGFKTEKERIVIILTIYTVK